MVLCVAMLVGMTFAWFTDTASTSVNKIQAGELKIKLLGSDDEELGENNPLTWQKLAGHETESVLWEPNCEYNLETFKVQNAGNLAVKYKVVLKATQIETTTDGKSLLDVLEWKVNGTDVDFKTLGNGIEIITDKQLLKGAIDVISVSAHMKAEAGNDYQGLEIDGFGVEVYATQLNSENDSYGPDYDKNAQYPDVAYRNVTAPTEGEIAAGTNKLADALVDAATENKTIVADLSSGTYKLTDKEGTVRDVVKGMDVVLTGAGEGKTTYEVKKPGATGEGTADYSFDGAKSVTFKDMTIEFGANTDYQGFVRAGAITFENCTIKGMGANWGVGDVVFDECEFVFADEYNQWTNSLWTYGGASFTFNKCTFTSKNGKFINVYRQANPDTVIDVTLNECKFINKAATANKAAVNIKSQCAWNVTINKCTTEGAFPGANEGLWQSAPDYGTANAGNKVTVNR